MAIYRNISMSFWTDTKVVDEFSPEDKYFMLYCLTNPYTNLCGCYEISIKQMVRDTWYNEETIFKLLNRLEKNYNVIKYNKENKEILIINWKKYNWTKSEKLDKPLLEEIKNIKTVEFKEKLAKIYNERDTVSIPYTYTMDTTVSVSVTDTVSDSNNKSIRKKFIKPNIEEINQYCKERQNGINAENFYDFYESKNWYVGKNKMADWKACIRTWEKRTNTTNETIPEWFDKEIEKKTDNVEELENLLKDF